MEKQLIENPELKALANITLDAETMFNPEIVDNTLAIIKEKALDFEADITTKKGQDVYRSKAMMVRKIKTLWVGYGEGINREEKKSITIRNIELKKIKEFLDEVAVKVREALTEQEAIEEKAKAKEAMIIKDLLYYYSVDSDLPIETFQNLIEQIKAIEITGDILSDFFIRATQSKESSLASLEKKLADKVQYDKDQAELEILRKGAAEQKEKDDKEQAEKEALKVEKELKKKIRKEADDKAAKKIADAKAAEEKAKSDAKEAEAKAEHEKIDAAAKAEREKKAAVEEAERKAKEEYEAKERDRLAKEKAEREEDEKKAADNEHRAKVKAESTRFIRGIFGTTGEQADAIFDAISTGEVPHISVKY